MKFSPTQLDGVLTIDTPTHADSRGEFVKFFNDEVWRAAGITFEPKEVFCSVSNSGVLRGMHFQTPPGDHAKSVFCTAGRVMDVVLDLRTGSRTFGEYACFELGLEATAGLFMPRGFAHGFLVKQAPATMTYLVDHGYDPACDMGVRWDSFGLDWGVDQPVLSERDQKHPALADFDSPF